jgi:hypothetical protein
MSEFRRKRIYYTKAQVTTGLYTEGNEWMFINGEEYIGQYHKYTTEEVFSEPNFVKDKSRILIPYIPPIGTQDTIKIGGVPFDASKNFVYDQIKEVKFKKSLTPNDIVVEPTEKDFKRGYMERYFAHKINDKIVIELDKDNFSNIGKDGGLDKNLWEKIKIRWKVSGPEYDQRDKKSGILKESGIIDTNRRTTAIISEKYPHMMDVLVDLSKFSI